MKIVCKKTTELSDDEIKGFLNCYDEVFETKESLRAFKNEYLNTCLGYSFHSFMYDDNDNICGGLCVIPMKYNVNGEEHLFGTGADFMVKKDCGSTFADLASMMNSPFKYMKENGFSVYFGFPNDNADLFDIKLLRCTRIAHLDTYILPYRISDYKKKFSFLNPLSKLFSLSLLTISRLWSVKKEYRFPISKQRPLFENTRYKWFDEKDYVKFERDGVNAVWKVASFEGIQACFLIDVWPLSKRNFDIAVRNMVCSEKDKCGIFIYVGILPFSTCSMIKIPRKVEPKKFRFDVKILDNKRVDKNLIMNPSNWEVNLSSYDLI